MRRGPAGTLLLCAAILLALTIGSWSLLRVAFDDQTAAASVSSILDDDALRADLAAAVGAATGERLGQAPEVVAAGVVANFDAMLNDSQVRGILRDVVGEAHDRLTGDRDEAPDIDGQELVFIVRHQAVFDVAPATLAIDHIGWLGTVETLARWMMILLGIVGVIALILGIAARPSRADVVFAIGVASLATAVTVFLFGYVVPGPAIGALTSSPWASMFAAVAADHLPLIGGVAVVLGVIGAVLTFGSLGLGRRKTKNWSAPVRPTRYNTDQRQWSR